MTAIDPVARQAVTGEGSAIEYGSLIWAAGGHARRLPCEGGNLAGVHTVRSRADVDQLMTELPDVRRVVVVGGGYIGLEAAAVLTKLGRHVSVVEALGRVLARVAGERLSQFYEAEHRSHGVVLRLQSVVDRLEGAAGRVTGVHLTDGSHLPADMVIVGIGILPSVAPLLAAGAEGGNGVRVDALCRTSLPGIYAVGDCAEHQNPFADGDWVRVESVQNATDQAIVAAKHVCGAGEPYAALPWFWSNQYDLRLQTVGLSRGHDDVVLRGDPAQRSFSLAYLREGRVIALDCVNLMRDYVQGRKLVAERRIVDRARLADCAVALKML